MTGSKTKNAWIALGSNLGDRLEMLRFAVASLQDEVGISIIRASSVYETPPLGPPGQSFYLNAVLHLEVTLDPQVLLSKLHRIEILAGRVRSTTRNEPRVLDLDLLSWEFSCLESKNLTLPHPRMHQRDFVLVPLLEIEPQWIHPKLKKGVKDLLDSLPKISVLQPLPGVQLWPL